MWVIALCHDVAFESSRRSALFQAHAAHNVARISAFLLTAPIATADGVSGRDNDPRLVGSIYCLEVDGLEAAREIMETDPYMGGAWRRIDYYQWPSPTGTWLDPAAVYTTPATDFRCYVACSRAPLEVGRPLIGGAVTFLGSTGEGSELLADIAIFQAMSFAAAKARAPGADLVASIPIAIGRWMGVSSPADLARMASA